MRRSNLFLLCAMLTIALWANGQANSRTWQAGTLVETEQTKVYEGSTKNTSTDGSVKDRGDQTDYSRNSTTRTTDNYDTFQVYTIEAGQKIYVAREQLLFPWSKPATTNVGEQVKFAVEKGKLYLMGDDGKEHKASVSKVSMKAVQ